MRISNNRIFPYPVMRGNEYFTDLKGSIYNFNVDIEQDEKYLYLKNVNIDFNNKYIDELLEKNIISAYMLIEDPKTIYRESFLISKESQDFSIEIKKLNHEVEITSFLVANQDFEYKDDSFIDDYSNYFFFIEKGYVLAINTGFDVTIDYSGINDNKISSIFLITCDTEEAKDMKVLIDRKKIKIFLPKNQYDIYYNLKFSDRLRNMFYSIIGIPALVKALSEIYYEVEKEAYDDIDEIEEDYYWFKTIKNAYKKNYNKDLDIETFKELDIVEVSQVFLGHSTSNSIDDIIGLFEPEKEGDDEDEY